MPEGGESESPTQAPEAPRQEDRTIDTPLRVPSVNGEQPFAPSSGIGGLEDIARARHDRQREEERNKP